MCWAAHLFGVRDVAAGEVLTMTTNGWLQIIVFLLVVLVLTKPLGAFMTRVFNREKTFLDHLLRPAEKLIYRLTGVDESSEMGWKEYAGAMLMFSGVTMALTYLIGRRHLAGHRHRARDRATREGHARKFLGGCDAGDAVGAAAVVHCGRAVLCVAGRGAEF